MTTRERIDRLAPVLRKFPELGCRGARDLRQWLELELGSADALDSWQKRAGAKTRAVAPAVIYHVLAGNLDVSGQHSLLCGLLLGAQNILKLPSVGGEEVLRFVRALPVPLRKLVVYGREFDAEALARADAVIAYGRDETIAQIHAQTRWDQIFLGYGLQVSLAWLGQVKRVTPRLVAALAHDVCIYDQMGCLSPQVIYCEPGSATELLGEALAAAMSREIARLPQPVRTAADAGQMLEAVDTARALGHRVWLAGKAITDGAVILDPRPAFQFSCLHRVIFLKEIAAARLPQTLASLRGKISTVGLAHPLSPREEKLFSGIGVKRFCPIGKMQHPPLWWHHDGRPSISDLVRWVDHEIL